MYVFYWGLFRIYIVLIIPLATADLNIPGKKATNHYACHKPLCMFCMNPRRHQTINRLQWTSRESIISSRESIISSCPTDPSTPIFTYPKQPRVSRLRQHIEWILTQCKKAKESKSPTVLLSMVGICWWGKLLNVFVACYDCHGTLWCCFQILQCCHFPSQSGFFGRQSQWANDFLPQELCSSPPSNYAHCWLLLALI